MRALAFRYICEHKTIYIGDGELIVGERGPEPLAVPTFPELTCHSLEDLRDPGLPRARPATAVSDEVIETYRDEIIPFWQGRSLRDRIFPQLPPEWHDAYAAGVFTEFMEQRAPGHTVADGKIYSKGLLDFKAEIGAAARAARISGNDPAGPGPARAARGHAHRRRGHDDLRAAPRRASRRDGRGASPTRSAGPSWSTSPTSASACPPTRRGSSARRCRPTGSTTWAWSPN